jgi:3-oxoacyl-[acyl-carrier protein] reductase
MTSSLNDKVVIVTGSSSGIGAAVVRQLAEKGCNVVINFSRSQGPADGVAEECRALGVKTLVVKANISDDADCKRLVSETEKAFGRIDGLVNNAGTTKFVAHNDLDGLSGKDFLDIYQVNVVGAYQMIRAAAPILRNDGGGSVVNVSSIAGVMGTGSCIAYAASKGALNTMTLSLARTLGPEIRVNTVCPGFVQGDWLRNGMGAERYDATKAHLEATNPLRRAGGAEHMAEAVVMFLEAGKHITGEFLLADGGQHLGGAPIGIR